VVNKVIQAPVDKELLKDLNSLSKRQHKARAELICLACLSYLKRLKEEELDKVY